MWYIHAKEYYSAIKKKEIVPSAATWMDTENVILTEIRQKRRDGSVLLQRFFMYSATVVYKGEP